MIVPKEEIKYIFNPYKLLPGDILLMNTYEERLRKKMGCRYEHAAIYIGDAYIMEANGAHVVMSHIYSYAFREENHACVLRLKKFSPITLSDIARAARRQMGREYSALPFRHVREFKNTDNRDYGNRSFCSRLVAQSYLEENIKIVTNADYCEPDDFLNSELLERIPEGITTFTDDLEKVVMNNQNIRKENEIDSPIAELYSSLGKLYNEDIQDLNQFISASLNKPEFDEFAIQIVESSKMFKHLDLVKREIPWFFDDKKFLEHYTDSDEAMHFLYSQLNHYDHTILPYYKELHLQTIVLAKNYSQSKLLVFLRDTIKQMVEDAVTCRKRLEALYILMFYQRKDDFELFIKKYGLYFDFEYHEQPINLDFILREMIKSS